MPELAATADVAIVGGGLAGLTLALQLKQSEPSLEVVVFERRKFPMPEAAHKVGESTVEIGSHYLAHTLGLRQLLEKTQLRKFGLRFFFGAGLHSDLSRADELGASNFLPAVSYQLDRGRLENDLAQLLSGLGVAIVDGSRVTEVSLGRRTGGHQVSWSTDGKAGLLRCHWVIDAAGRARLLARKLELAVSSDHTMNSAWFRLDARLDVEDWSSVAEWRQRCNGIPRMFSTNHLLGSGYWVWLIPLVGDRLSVGIVADPGQTPHEQYNSFEKFRAWSTVNQPLLAEYLDAHSGKLLDFRFLKDFSHGCERTFAPQGWALTGEAGVFADPFYSPGTDFIAISNTLICSLVLGAGDDPMRPIRAAVYNKIYQSFFDSTMSLYRSQYSGFGDTRLMVLKATWDYAYYWSVLAWLYFRERLTDIAFLRGNESSLNQARELNFQMQGLFRERASRQVQSPGSGRFFDQTAIPVLLNLNGALLTSTPDDAQELRENCARLSRLAPLVSTLLAGRPAFNPVEETELLGDLRKRFG